VPLASEIVAWVPGVVLPRYFMVVPVVTNEPTVLVTPGFKFSVPPVKVSALVEPSVKASRQLVVPVPPKVTGKSIVLVLLVIVCVPAPLNVVVNVPAVSVMPADSVRLPEIVRVRLLNAPAKPVKSTLLAAVLNPIISVPAVTFTFIAPAVLADIVLVPTAPEYVKLTVGVVVKVSPVDEVVFQTAPPPPVISKAPDPWVRVLAVPVALDPLK
jgi:hypothetical protein